MNGLDNTSYALACRILASANEMTLATLRADGSPHASTVHFASDGLVLYAAVAIDSHKAHDIRGDARVSLTVNAPYRNWHEIQGLAIDGMADMVHDAEGQQSASIRLLQKLPAYASLVGAAPALPWPGMLFIRIVPRWVTVLDYTQRFGHSQRFEVKELS